MTKSSDSPVTRETSALYRGVPIVVELGGGAMKLRLKGKGPRDAFMLDYEVAYYCAMNVAIREAKRAKGK